jgi:L-aspartate oxidase
MSTFKTDILIIGSGLAGLSLALKLPKNLNITIAAKEGAPDTNTAMAQGGIAAVLSEEDSFESHIQDTLVAGAGLCKIETVNNIVRQAPDRIKELIDWGVHFDVRKDDATEASEIDLTREGGHSFRRILHHEDQTGQEVHRQLLHQVRDRKNIQILEHHLAIDLIVSKQIDPYDLNPTRCVGGYFLDKQKGEVVAISSRTTILATGGAGKVYLYTTNWSGATGDGIAMAYRAGARVANLEFMQFHPTCLFHRESRNFLISEALRGEGGELVDREGHAFMRKYHTLGALAPRDIVARSIDAEMKKSGAPCVYLDMTKLRADFVKNRFPSIYARCLEFGIDITKEPIPVVPAAHYLCGGVLTDVNGRTDINGLWAIGETGCNGLHGANRLASNSLLECLATAHNCAEDMAKNWSAYPYYPKDPPEWVYPKESNADEMIVIHHMWEEIRRLMWNYVGIVRSDKRLLRAQNRLRNILSEVREYYSNFQIHSDIIELRNIAIVADLSVECALRRKESRGIHYNLDYPFAAHQQADQQGSQQNDSPPKDTILFRGPR